jgi:hypothetical protein
MATVEERLDNLEWRLKYHKIVSGLLTLLLFGSVGARAWDQWKPGELTCTVLKVVNEQGEVLVVLSPSRTGNGGVWTRSPEGKRLVSLTSTAGHGGEVATYSLEEGNKRLVALGADGAGNGGVWTMTTKAGDKQLD